MHDLRPPTAANASFASAAEKPPPSLLSEFWSFLRCRKRWWLAPILLGLLLVSVFVLLGSTTAAPVIYLLF